MILEKYNNIIIFGAGDLGIYIKKILEQKNIKIKFFSDNNLNKQGNILEGIEIVDLNQLKKILEEEINTCIIVSIRNYENVLKQLRENDIKNDVYVVDVRRLSKLKSPDDFIYLIEIDLPRLDYLEYEVTHSCNLKCKGCSHFSNLERTESFGDYVAYIKDLRRLKELFNGINLIRLLGGEPLLNPELKKYIDGTRTIFRDSKIQIVTNGLLIPKMSEELIEVIKKCNVEIEVSQYPAILSVKDKIVKTCIDNDLTCKFLPLTEDFFERRNSKGNSNKIESWKNCISKTCHYLENGKMSVCPRPFMYRKVSNVIGISKDLLESDMIDIYDRNITGDDILKFLSAPIETCRYCFPKENVKIFKWESNYTELL